MWKNLWISKLKLGYAINILWLNMCHLVLLLFLSKFLYFPPQHVFITLDQISLSIESNDISLL